MDDGGHFIEPPPPPPPPVDDCHVAYVEGHSLVIGPEQTMVVLPPPPPRPVRGPEAGEGD